LEGDRQLSLPRELHDATEAQYAAYLKKALSKDRLGLAPVNAKVVLDGLVEKIAALAHRLLASNQDLLWNAMRSSIC
jgi:hypothetical protein